MDDFSRSDRLRALCLPLACCLPSSSRGVQLSEEGVEAGPSTSAADSWYVQTAAQDSVDWTLSRDVDALSLHEGVFSGSGEGGEGTGSTTTTSRRRLRVRGGDACGGGADTGSGLTRWALFKSWWRSAGGGGGGVRLPDSDEEGEENYGAGGNGGRFALDDENAVPLSLDDVGIPPAPPSSAHPAVPGRGKPGSSSSSVSGSSSTSRRHRQRHDLPLSPVLSESTTLVDPAPSEHEDQDEEEEEEAREARRARRQARRAARELGISTEEFLAGSELPEEEGRYLDVQPLPHGGMRSGRKGSSRSGAGSSRSRNSVSGEREEDRKEESGRRRRELSTVEEDGEARSHRSRRRSRRDRDLDAETEGGGSSRGSAYSGEGHKPHHHGRGKHRSHASISTTSSGTTAASSSRRSRSSRHDKQHSPSFADGPPHSPLHSEDGEGAEPQFYEDENGQLQPYYPSLLPSSPTDLSAPYSTTILPENALVGEDGVIYLPVVQAQTGESSSLLAPPHTVHASPSSPSFAGSEPTAYDHIGVLPPPSPLSPSSPLSSVSFPLPLPAAPAPPMTATEVDTSVFLSALKRKPRGRSVANAALVAEDEREREEMGW
ncbi:hypothetical protein JCM8547_004689 [Rhodosporidiobolus lusitaniae]